MRGRGYIRYSVLQRKEEVGTEKPANLQTSFMKISGSLISFNDNCCETVDNLVIGNSLLRMLILSSKILIIKKLIFRPPPELLSVLGPWGR